MSRSNELYGGVVIDIGGFRTKAGFSGDDAPRGVFPTVVGRVRLPAVTEMFMGREIFVAEEAITKRGLLNLNTVVEKGLVNNWDDLEKILVHCYENELIRSNPDEWTLFMTESDWNPRVKREITAELVFEVLKTAGFYLCGQSLASITSSGRRSGMCLNIGYETTSCMVIYGGQTISHTLVKQGFGGKDLLDRLCNLMKERGYSITWNQEMDILRDMKEKKCWVCEDVTESLKNLGNLKSTYELPDGSKVELDRERFLTPEVLFNPSLHFKNGDPNKSMGVHKIVADSMNAFSKQEEDFHALSDGKKFVRHVAIAGGSSCFNGLRLRVKREIEKNVSIIMNVIAIPERNYSSWIGGSILSSLSSYQQEFITKKEYEEHGRKIIHRKCPNYCEKTKQIVWSTKTHKFFRRKLRKWALYLIWCCFQEESELYVVPVEVVMIIVSFAVDDLFVLNSVDFQAIKNGIRSRNGEKYVFKF